MHFRIFLIFTFSFILLFAKNTVAQSISVSSVSGTISGCVGSASFSPNIQQFLVTGNSLTSDISVTAPANFEIAVSVSGSYSSNIILTRAGGNVSATIFVRSSQTAPLGNIAGSVSLISAGAVSQNVPVSGTVNALPTVNPVGNQSILSGQLITPITFTGTSQAFNWVNDNPAIGLTTTGSGDIPAFTATNTGSAPITATITATPVPAGFIYTANHNSNNVTVINSGANNVVATIPVGQQPRKAVVSPNGKFVYVVNLTSSNISVIDALTNTVIATIPVGPAPLNVVFNSDGSRAYVINYNNVGNVSVINTTSHSVIGTIATPIFPNYIAINPDGNHIYVSTYGTVGNGTTYVINANTNAIEATIPISGGIISVLFSPDGSKMYVLDLYKNYVTVVNTLSNSIVSSIPVGTYPTDMVITADGSRLYVANTLSNTVTVINTQNNTVIATANSADYAIGIALSRDEKYLYVTGRRSEAVFIISTTDYSTVKTIPITGTINNPVSSPDGSRVYFSTDDGKLHIINTATNSLITSVPVGINAQLRPEFISKGNGCSGNPISFTITVNPLPPAINTSGSLSALTTSYGTPSSTTNFSLDGTNLSSSINISAPAGFEISLDNSTFNNVVTLGNGGNIPSTTIHVRLSKTSPAGNYSGNITLTSSGVPSVDVSVPNSIVQPAVLTITANDATKPYGTILPNITGSNAFTVTGLKNGETIGTVDIAYPGQVITAPAGPYQNGVVPSNASGGTFNNSNYLITYNYGTLTILPPPTPVINFTGTLAAINTTFGTASATSSFIIFGNHLLEAISINAPTGFELSLDNSNFNSTLTVGTGGTVNSTTVYIRLASTTNAGTYNGNIKLVSLNAQTINIPVNGLVGMVPITIIANDQSKFYGAVLPGAANLPYTISGTLKNGNTIANVNLNYGSGAAANENAGTYQSAITLANIVGGTGYLASNYSITFVPGTIKVLPQNLTIKAPILYKSYGTSITGGVLTSGLNITGLQNQDKVSSVIVSYGNGASASSPVGVYSNAATIMSATGNLNPNNYIISYQPADIEVNAVSLLISADNKSKIFGTANPTLTVKYSGFVNNDDVSSLIKLPVISTTASENSPEGTYPINVSGALNPNYNINYASGILTIDPEELTAALFPNTFTPNDDGINDTWQLKQLNNYPSCLVRIFTRNGQLIYSSIGYSIPWDGKFNGSYMPTGVYYYTILPKNGKKEVGGFITLIR